MSRKFKISKSFDLKFQIDIQPLHFSIVIYFRYVVILYPFRARMQVKTCAVLVGVINLLSMLFTAPYVHIMDSVEIEASPDKNITQCQVSDDDNLDIWKLSHLT